MKRLRYTSPPFLTAVVTGGIVLWMLSGLVDRPESAAAPEQEAARPADEPVRVAVQTSLARPITREIMVSARTEPNRVVELRAETDGRVTTLGAARGSAVRAGAPIVGLDMRDRQARLEEARAAIAQMELQHEAALRLQRQQFVSETQIAEAVARVETARARLAAVELEIANTEIRAPFDAVLQERDVELGDYVSAGDRVAELVDIDPLIVVGEVSERDIRHIVVGRPGVARLLNGPPVEGTVRYVAPVANPQTRTFRVELAVPNPDGALRAGVTAEMRLAADETSVHVLSAALLSLGDHGTVGVKSVNEANRVEFWPVEIVASSQDGVSVAGLPPELRVITVGHGFVREGDLVMPVESPPTGLSEAAGGARALRLDPAGGV
ncbi:MAG TPA: efflux RND transporter periplasmic adaptor subunit [Gammaproteobacteria bacterium]